MRGKLLNSHINHDHELRTEGGCLTMAMTYLVFGFLCHDEDLVCLTVFLLN